MLVRLDLLAYNQERYLWQQFSIAKIRQSEPPELNIPPETGTVPSDLIAAHIEQLGYSVSDLAGLLHVGTEDLQSFDGITVHPEPKAPHLRIVK